MSRRTTKQRRATRARRQTYASIRRTAWPFWRAKVLESPPSTETIQEMLERAWRALA